ncbi:unnamed protein product, partial [Mesorhabditis spiculigera]
MVEEALVAGVEYRIVCGISYCILSLIGLFAHSIVIFLFVQRRRILMRNAFYTLALHMTFCDVVSLIVQLVVAVPLTLTARNVYADLGIPLIYNMTNFIDTVIFNSLMVLTFWMAVNRLTVFWSYTINDALFGRRAIICLIAITYLYCLTDTTTRQFFGCIKNFSTDGFYFFHKCIPGVGQTILDFNGFQNIALPIGMFSIYFGLFLYLRAYLRIVHGNSVEHSNFGKRHAEFSLLIQGSIICAFLELQTLSFMLFSKIPVSGMGTFYLTFLQNIISIMNNCVSPVIYFTCNQDMRAYARESWRQFRGENTDLALPVATRMSQRHSRVSIMIN